MSGCHVQTASRAHVKFTVVHALGRDPGSEATAMLRGFVDDASGMVAGEARRYLRER